MCFNKTCREQFVSMSAPLRLGAHDYNKRAWIFVCCEKCEQLERNFGQLILRSFFVSSNVALLSRNVAENIADSCFYCMNRSEQAYDDAHITKPPRKSVNIPYPCSDFVIKVQSKFPNKEAQILVVR